MGIDPASVGDVLHTTTTFTVRIHVAATATDCSEAVDNDDFPPIQERQSLQDGGRGKVLYFVARPPHVVPPTQSDENEETFISRSPIDSHSLIQPPVGNLSEYQICSSSEESQGTYLYNAIVPIDIQNEVLIGFANCETLEYSLMHRIREKCCKFCNEPPTKASIDATVAAYIKKFARTSLRHLSTPLLMTFFEPLVEKYVYLLRRALK